MSRRKKNKIRKRGLPPGSLVYTGDRIAQAAGVTTVWYSPSDYTENLAYQPEYLNKGFGVVWVDIRHLSEVELIERIGVDFQIHPLALEDVLNTQQRAKLEEYDNGLFFVIPNLKINPDSNELISEQIAVFAGKNFVVSFQEDSDDNFIHIRKRAQEGVGRMRKKNADYLAYSLMDNVIDGYYLVLDDIEAQLLDLEEFIHSGGANSTCKTRIFELKRLVNQFRHRIIPMRDATTRFYRTESDVVEDPNRLYLRDLADHVAQILDGIDNERDILDNMEALYHAEAANKLNDVMRVLTVISTIFMPLSFIAGLYGMNFDNMPELHWHNGYFIILGVMFGLLLAMLFYFRRQKWF